MYLAPYIACVGVFSVALMFAVRCKQLTSLATNAGIIVRAVLTFLIFAFCFTLWHYTGVHYLKNETIQLWVRIITSLVFVCSLPEIWLEDKRED